MKREARAYLIPVLLITLVVKLILAAALPFSGDEAYFFIWGQRLDFGYYDHPPMVGWLLWLMLQLGHAEWVLRLPIVLFTSFIGWGLYRLLRDWDDEKAALVALLYLCSPINLIGVLITTDAGLIIFSFLCVALLTRALASGRQSLFIAAGVALGLAFLSKYFAVLLAVAIILYWLTTPAARKHSRGFVWLLLATLPFIALNLYWNYTHCWANILFNVYNRHGDAKLDWHRPLVYGLTQLYLITPWVAWWLIKKRKQWAASVRAANLRLFAFAFLVPAAIFAVLSLEKLIGLHWLLSFYPFLFVLMAGLLSAAELRRAWRYTLIFSIVHLLAITILVLLPMSAWQGSRYADGAVIMLKPQAVLDQLEPYRGKFTLATDGYSAAAILTYHGGENVAVFGEASSHARHDDLVTDFRNLDERNIVVFLKKPPEFDKFGPYFKSIRFSDFTLYGVKFYLVEGVGFNYAAYRDAILSHVRQKYYAIPAYLPVGACYFCERYFAGSSCHLGAHK